MNLMQQQNPSLTTLLFPSGPVSHPVLTLKAPRAQAVVGDMVELHCKALRGSPPILYRFYHEDVIMGNSSAPSGGGVSFNFSLTVDHSGNYSCDANNGLGSQHSHRVSLKVIGKQGIPTAVNSHHPRLSSTNRAPISYGWDDIPADSPLFLPPPESSEIIPYDYIFSKLYHSFVSPVSTNNSHMPHSLSNINTMTFQSTYYNSTITDKGA
jgi:hypothetical protein